MSRHRRLEVALSLAQYVGVAPSAALARSELQRDLGLEPLDVVLFVLSFQESDDTAFRYEDLEHVVTAGELIAIVSSWLDEYDRNERLADEDEPVFSEHVGMA